VRWVDTKQEGENRNAEEGSRKVDLDHTCEPAIPRRAGACKSAAQRVAQQNVCTVATALYRGKLNK
jgi:hypothetical protein